MIITFDRVEIPLAVAEKISASASGCASTASSMREGIPWESERTSIRIISPRFQVIDPYNACAPDRFYAGSACISLLYMKKGGFAMSNINSPGNMTPEQLMKLAASFGGKDAADPEKAINAVSKQLSDEKRQKLNEVLSDKSALEKLLQSPEAQRLMKKFGVDNKG